MKRVFAIFICALFLAGCTKEIPDAPVETDLMKVDLTGYWNGYGYYDLSGLVPLEIIEITKNDSGKYIATKIVGDNAVFSGMITWQGYRNSNPFIINFTVSNGETIFIDPTPVKLRIVSANKLEAEGQDIKFIRRTDGYFP